MSKTRHTYFDDDYCEESITEDNTPPDCVVLEIYANNEIYDERKRVFIWYDLNKCNFILRGKQDDTKTIIHIPFNFESKKASYVADFLCLIFDKRSNLEVALYNFTDFPLSSNDITFEMLESNEYSEIIYTHDDYSLKKSKIKDLLKIVKNIYNNNY
jgi:hypothetical protein